MTPPDAPLLAFDTSAAHCAAALLSGDRILAECREEMARGQAERLFPMLEEMLAELGATWRDLGRIGVGIGPGNFTGIRLSVAAARGLALSLGVPAIGVSGFAALAEGRSGPVVATIDGRRDSLYLQGFAPDSAPVHCSLGALPDAGWRAPVCIGHRAAEVAARLGGTSADPALPFAVAIARAASRATPGARPAPLYLRAPDAAPPRVAPPRAAP